MTTTDERLEHERELAAREAAAPLVLEFIRTRRALIRENDAIKCGAVEVDLDAPPGEIFNAGFEAYVRLVEFLGATYAAKAVVDELDHHFAADYSEIHGNDPTLTFTNELDRVILAGGKDAFERYLDEHPSAGRYCRCLTCHEVIPADQDAAHAATHEQPDLVLFEDIPF